MDIVIISHFCMDFSQNDNDRFLYIAKKLSPKHDVEIVTSDFYHTKKTHRSTVASPQPCKVTFLHEPGYPKNISFRRFYSHYVWGMNVRKYLEGRKVPDVVYCAVPSLTAAKQAAVYCKKHKVRFLIDIQDLWPEAYKMVVNIPVVSDIVFSPFSLTANHIYRHADGVVAVSETYLRRGLKVNKDCKCSEVVFLGTELSEFDANRRKEPVMKKPEGELWLGYSGTLGASYDIGCVIDAIAGIRDGVRRPKFIVMGDGNKAEEFRKHAQSKGIDAVFMGRLPYDLMCATLSQCDLAVNPITKGSAGSIINKHADYAASGLPVLNTQESEEYRALVEKYEMGFNCRNGDPADLCEKMTTLIVDPELRARMGRNARRCAADCFDRGNTYHKITSMIEGTDHGEV